MPRARLFERHGEWDRWQGSPAEIGWLADRAETWMREHFAAAAGHTVRGEYTVATERWAGGVSGVEHLVREIEVRRRVTIISIRARAFPKGVSVPPWPVDKDEYVPVTGAEDLEGVVGVDAPMVVDLEFQPSCPAVRMRIVAPHAQLCTILFDHMAPHVESGAKPLPPISVPGVTKRLCPPLELIGAGGRTRWQRAKRGAIELVLFAIAVASLVLSLTR